LKTKIYRKKREFSMANINIQDVVTGKVRLSYVHLFTPYASQHGADPKYSSTILVPKTDIATKQRIDAAINAAIHEGVASRWNGVRPPVLAIPIYDGDGVRPSDGMPFGEECKGHWVFTASSKQAPEIVDIAMQRILNQTEIYSGIYARVSVRFFPYASNGKKGIGCGLGPVQKIEDGEPLGGRISASTAFGDNGSFTPMPAQTPAYTQPTHYMQGPAYNPQMPGFGQIPMNTPKPTYQPNYSAPAQQMYPQAPVNSPQQPVYGQPMLQGNLKPPVQIDPITGAPINGGVMGI
jgi:hypothetical protein